MDSKHIEQLLEKYWNCETSLEEEKQLRDYFQGENIPGQWKEASELFRYFEQQKQRSLADPAFESGVMKKIRNDRPKGKVVFFTRNLYRIAAGLVVVIAATYFVRQELRKSYPSEDTYSDPKIAFEETKKALMMISKGFGKAHREATKINLFNDAEQKIHGKTAKKKEVSNI
jgi:hypothetical protein